MQKQIHFKGTRWYKCDLHLHTTASLCFHDRTVTAQQWVEKAIEQGLDCVAVTDHNTGVGIDAIKEAAKGTDLTIFPGVEITCDTSKVHLLILFDITKTSGHIRDFLVRANIKADDFGKQDASTTKSIFEIAELASTDGALVIPAHIDEYNGLGSIGFANLKTFFTKYNINAVQVVHREFLDQSLQTKGNEDLKRFLNDYYNNPNPKIDDSKVKEWFTPVKCALENNLAILTFSDNPHEAKNAKHGLWGIGSHYTWLKMDEKPSLEGLRQALLLPKYRVRNLFDSTNNPFNEPDLWIKSISVSNTTITHESTALKVDFSPQLNTLIGGRGSGKSSILRFIRGVFNRNADLEELLDIHTDQTDFYKKEDGRSKKGVFTENSTIEIEFVRNEVLHKIIASEIDNSAKQKIKVERLKEDGSWENVDDEGYLDFFEYEHYSQKQIYEIAQKPNALRERIDQAIDNVEKLKEQREHTKRLFLEKSVAIRTAKQRISGKGKIETRIKDLDTSIRKLQQSGIADLLTAKEKFTKEKEKLDQFVNEIEKRKNIIGDLIDSIDLPDIDFSKFELIHQTELRSSSKKVVDNIAIIKQELLKLKNTATKLKSDFETSVDNSQWKADQDKNVFDFHAKKVELENDGIDAITSFEKFTQEKADLERDLEDINTKELQRNVDARERELFQSEHLTLSKRITEERRRFLDHILTGNKVKINVRPFRNRGDFETRLRKILQREGHSFQQDFDALMNLCFQGNVEQKIKDVRDVFLKIRVGEDISEIVSVSGYFINLVKSMNDAQIDEIELLLPEDEIEIQYKPTLESAFKSLSTASAGQKTTAILTFILSYGKLPLILDQPEDDLDNRLVYELIVDRLKQAKENRQIIVVTHNANIPVNGDAEYIISMDCESKTLKVLHAGTVEQMAIKKEICDVMEGGQQAFDMRSKRYQ